MKHKFAILFSLLAVLTVASGCTKSAVNDQQLENRAIPGKEPTKPTKLDEADKVASPTIASSSSAINTDRWRTYRSAEYGFDIKYPLGWNIKEDSWIVSGETQKYVEIDHPYDHSFLIIQKSDVDNVQVNMHMDVGLLENITIGGFKTKIAYWENNLNEKGYNYFFQTNKGGLAVSFLPRGGFVKDKSIFYKIINTIKFR